MSLDPSRLYSLLLKTGLQQKDNRLWQIIHDLIGAVANLNNPSGPLSIISGGGSTVLTQIIQAIPGLDGLDGEDALVIQGLQGLQGAIGPQGVPGFDGEEGGDIFIIVPPEGVDGTFTTVDSKTVTVKKGIITSIV